MTRAEAASTLADFRTLHRAHVAAAYAPLVPPPQASISWYSATPLLLAFCQRVLDEGIKEDTP